jgi:predicted phosphodiesterase
VRVLVIADIHRNLAALEAVLAVPHDALVCLGDLVGYGPEPGACTRAVRSAGALVVRGNHDHALAYGVPPGCRRAFEWLAEALAPLGSAQLDAGQRAWLGSRPLASAREYDGRRYLFVHATPSDPLRRYVGPEPDAWAREIVGVDADAVVVGHTHIQFQLSAGQRWVINPGSVGQPKDGDPRAAYLLLDGGAIRPGRAGYDVERTVAALARSPVDSAAVAFLTALLRTGRTP